MKYEKLKDRPGAIADFRAAARLYRANGQTEYRQIALRNLQTLGATEDP